MTVSEVMAAADELRPNAIDEKTKARWVFELEGHVAERMQRPVPAFDFPTPHPLLLPSPHDGVYVKYLAAMVDWYQGETALYENDRALFNAAMQAAADAWRSGRQTTAPRRWEVLP